MGLGGGESVSVRGVRSRGSAPRRARSPVKEHLGLPDMSGSSVALTAVHARSSITCEGEGGGSGEVEGEGEGSGEG